MLFPTNSHSSWACPRGMEKFTCMFHYNKNLSSLISPLSHKFKSQIKFSSIVCVLIFKWQGKSVHKQQTSCKHLPAAHYCSCPQWCGHRRCQLAPPARLGWTQCAVCLPRWTACLHVLETAYRCGSVYPPGRPPKTAADATTPLCTEGEWIKQREMDEITRDAPVRLMSKHCV